jgi:hypothetical protein
MRGVWRVGVGLVLALAGAGAGLAQEDLATRVRRAQEAARANAESPQGREWVRKHSAETDKVMIPLLNKCLPEPGDIPTVFSVFVRLSPEGRAREVVTELDAAVGTCMTGAAREVRFPAAPREDYWIQVNMAAPL